jgi:hypothetical protein
MSSTKESRLDYVNTRSWKKSKTMDSQTQETLEIKSSDKYNLTNNLKTKKTPRKSLLQDLDYS